MKHGTIALGRALRPDAIVAAGAAIRSPGAVVLSPFPVAPDCHDLLTLAQGLGHVSKRGISSPHNPWVHRIAERAEPLLDSCGYEILSTTARDFKLHTDETFSSRPADVVIQLCVHSAECGGGATTLAFLDDVVHILPRPVVETLMRISYPAVPGLNPVITCDAGRYSIRYNPHELRRADLGERQVVAIAALEAAIARVAYRIDLSSGDCLVLNNKTVLHGRTSFRSPSSRLLFRVRVRKA